MSPVDQQLRVGLVGGGPWAKTVHAPGLAEHPGTALTAIWTRRPEAARELADAHCSTAVDTVDELLDQVDAVAFAVPPSVQAEIATKAAAAGKHLILEKPIAGDLAAAERLAGTVAESGVAALVMFTLRYAIQTQEWLAGLKEAGGWTGGSARWLSGALLNETYRDSAWRHSDAGALADVGPHAFDLLDAALGPITGVLAAHRTDGDLWTVLLEHEGGITSTAVLTLRLPIMPTVVELAVFGEHGFRCVNQRPGTPQDSYTALLDDFAALIASGTREHPCDVQRGLHIQRVIDQALRVVSK